MKRNDIVSTYVYFSNSSNGKSRPILILDDNNTDVEFFKLTTKFKNKSSYIQKKYFQIIDWKEAGLYQPTWIDTNPVISVPKELTTFKPIGQLSLNDIQRLIVFMKNQ
ncbi:toxin-antitoxin system, toxin component, MazF family protein [Lentilactobacillus buchneri]|jgi:mRNA interferase MazF|uniref:hypothetical protein n=1 Tax=Lentilactobacillus TaxID=2767893 RepID=UPI0006D0E740|nr:MULTISPECIES: hypothetical protein [Lentilactobacillus]MCT3543744.1 toxin-antitoxin system, toxin component, MazF family protein [Lentilactobacillus buchneri]